MSAVRLTPCEAHLFTAAKRRITHLPPGGFSHDRPQPPACLASRPATTRGAQSWTPSRSSLLYRPQLVDVYRPQLVDGVPTVGLSRGPARRAGGEAAGLQDVWPDGRRAESV